MASRNRFGNDISEAIHSSASALHKAGVIDKATMRDFDARHLAVPPAIEPPPHGSFVDPVISRTPRWKLR